MDLAPGDVVAGKYRIERVLGAGGMGFVVAATHLQLDEPVALKFLRPEVLNNAEAVARFGREARAAVRIKSEHVARVTDVGTLPTGAPYMVMEYLTGADLSRRIREGARFEIDQAVGLVLQACEAIAEAHALGIVHRDLKPANLFLTERPDGTTCVKVLDFGISKVTGPGAAQMAMTKTSAVMGSPQYMSPEQLVSARDVDARTDVWAVGVILYEMLAGRVPFDGESLPVVFSNILHQAPRPLSQVRPDVPIDLSDTVAKCLEKDRARRFENIAEFAAALEAYGTASTRLSVERVSRVLGVRPTVRRTGMDLSVHEHTRNGAAGGSTNAAWGQTQPAIGKQGGRVAVALAALAIVAGVALWMVHRMSSNPTAEVSSAGAAAASANAGPAHVTISPDTLPAPPSVGPATAPTSTMVTGAHSGSTPSRGARDRTPAAKASAAPGTKPASSAVPPASARAVTQPSAASAPTPTATATAHATATANPPSYESLIRDRQ